MNAVIERRAVSKVMPAVQAPAVVCRGVIKEFGQGETHIRVLRGIDLEVDAGTMTMLVGPSGCGKTTLISVMAATLDPTAGEVELLGTNVTASAPAPSAASAARTSASSSSSSTCCRP